jgi:hypothetical protein
MENDHIELGWIDIPKAYIDFDKEQKDSLCNDIIDILLQHIDRDLPKEYNRIGFLEDVFESSIITNTEQEQYEICCVLRDCIKLLNE